MLLSFASSKFHRARRVAAISVFLPDRNVHILLSRRGHRAIVIQPPPYSHFSPVRQCRVSALFRFARFVSPRSRSSSSRSPFPPRTWAGRPRNAAAPARDPLLKLRKWDASAWARSFEPGATRSNFVAVEIVTLVSAPASVVTVNDSLAIALIVPRIGGVFAGAEVDDPVCALVQIAQKNTRE